MLKWQPAGRARRLASRLLLQPVAPVPRPANSPIAAAQQLCSSCRSRIPASPFHSSAASWQQAGSSSGPPDEKEKHRRPPLEQQLQPVVQRLQDAIYKDRIATVPNALTVIRMGLAPYVAHTLLTGQPVTAFAAFVVAGALDGIDGWIARRFNQASIIGSYLDPLADKVLVAATSLTLAWTGGLPWWVVTVMVGRDVGLVFGGLWWRYKTRPAGVGFFDSSHASTPKVDPSTFSKANTALQLLLITCGLTSSAWGLPGSQALTALSALVTATTIGSGYQYWQKLPVVAVARKGAGGGGLS